MSDSTNREMVLRGSEVTRYRDSVSFHPTVAAVAEAFVKIDKLNARLAEVERERDEVAAQVGGAIRDRALAEVALAASQAREMALREALKACVGQRSAFFGSQSAPWTAAIDNAEEILRTLGAPSGDIDALREFGERVAREAASSMHAYMMWEHDRSEVEAREPDVAAIVERALGAMGGSDGK